MTDAVANAAKLLAEPARAAMLISLMGGRAMPAGELAATAHVSPPTASEHLFRLTAAGFVRVNKLGRHRYYELANEDIAHTVEALLSLSSHNARRSPDAAVPPRGTLQHARTCYTHIAGWLGVAITDALLQRRYLLSAATDAFCLSEAGKGWFESMGIAIAWRVGEAEPKLARRCPDWTERRPHLGGALGRNAYERWRELGWISPIKNSRVLGVSLMGRKCFQEHLRVIVN